MQRAIYRIAHSTTYTYKQPVRICHNIVMLTPRSGQSVRTLSHRLTVKPHPAVINRREDYFGNQIHAFSVEESHRQLVVTATGRVEVAYGELPLADTTAAWEQVRDSVHSQTDPRWLEACQFRFGSNRIESSPEFAEYAAQAFLPSRPILEAGILLTNRIFLDFEYDTDATTVDTPTSEAFRLRRGVCQDLAHVQITCLRSLGLSARYVSGYLRTEPKSGEPKLVGADESHAWVSLYCGQQLGWVDLDPTNDKLCDIDHIPVAWGRDYNDVVPVRGIFLGGGDHQIEVSVDVTPV